MVPKNWDAEPEGTQREWARGSTGTTEHLHGVDTHQPAPTRNNRAAIQDLVIADLEARKQVGLAIYLRQVLEERGA